MALYYRQITGEGQQVDISIHEAAVQIAFNITNHWDLNKVKMPRGQLQRLNVRVTRMWPCKDGHVIHIWMGGARGERQNKPTVRWMDSEGMADDFLKGLDWEALDFTATTQDVVDRIEEPTRKFFGPHTKAELMEGALKHRVWLYPVSTTKDIVESVQLAAREFWTEIEHPELSTTITYPGAFVHSSEKPPVVSRRAPLIGEHNQEVYEKELGISREELLILKQARVV